MIKNYYLIVIVLLFSFISCETDIDEQITPTLVLENTSIDFEKKSETKQINIQSTGDIFEISVDDEWCTSHVEDKILYISVSENTGLEVRNTNVTISYEGLSEKVTIRQIGESKAILINKNEIIIEHDDTEISFQITSNIEYDITLPTWIKSLSKTRSSMISKDYTGSVDPNISILRSGEILVKEKNNGTAESKIKVIQKGSNNVYDPAGDIKVQVTTAKASSWDDEETIENTFDGSYNTIYHSNFKNSILNYFPIDLEYNFDSEDIDYIIYHPAYTRTGAFKEVEIYATTEENSSLTKIQTYSFNGSREPTKIVFDSPLKNVTSIVFKVLSGMGNQPTDIVGFAACSEMEFYQQNPNILDPLTIFTDLSCSELKSGITLEDINKCKDTFYLQLAVPMFHNTYEKEFRIDSYKAYIYPETKQKEVKNAFPYGLLDNATGMIANTNEELIILVGETHGAEIKIRIHNLDNDKWNGYETDRSTYTLEEGVNRLKVITNGLIYVMYHSHEPENLAPINIHFINGEVNGYFDSQKHSPDDWDRLLHLAKNKHFDVLGAYAHLTFPTDIFKAHTPDGKELIDIYDFIVKEQALLMGLDDETMYKNRMYFYVLYSNDYYMYAYFNRTAYHSGTLSTICNAQMLKTDGIWGPAHEVGHCNQTIPDLKWVGMTEVTTNIFSLHIQRLLGQTSRLTAEKRYKSAHKSVKEEYVDENGVSSGPIRPYALLSSVFDQLVPFWQLYLYFDLDKNVDFYPELHRMVRKNHGGSKTEGEYALQFVRMSCAVSGYNLLDFFEYWGFFVPINRTIGDYGDATFIITQDQVDELKAEIEAKNYKTLKHDIWNITDENIDQYK